MLWTALQAFWLTLTHAEFRAKVTSLIQSLATGNTASTTSVASNSATRNSAYPAVSAESAVSVNDADSTTNLTHITISAGTAKRDPLVPLTSARSDAVTLLETLQREARWIDFLMEPLDTASDSQVGAVARDIHRDCGRTISRLFAITPVTTQEEGESIAIPAGYDPGLYRVTGKISGGTIHGTIVHPGWMVTRAELPKWNGRQTSEMVVAPVEVEAQAHE
ncbi:MAG: DUF2760 domain-containing protein [Thermoguttaceae bacterium]|nr:DUF2760 domain-containing protein [Thermoguttaceae bacterium]